MSRATHLQSFEFQVQLMDMFSLTALIAVLLLISKISFPGEIAAGMILFVVFAVALVSWAISLSILTTLRVGRTSKRFVFVFLFPLTIMLGSSWFVQAISLGDHLADETSIGWWPVLGLCVQLATIMLLRFGCDWVAAIDSDTTVPEPPKLFRR